MSCAFRDFSLFVSIFSCSLASVSFSFHLGQNACFLLFCSISGHPKYSLLFQHFLSKKIPSAKLIWNGFLRVSNYEDTGSLRWIIDWLCPQGFHELDQALQLFLGVILDLDSSFIFVFLVDDNLRAHDGL